jgi:hypothetical protein
MLEECFKFKKTILVCYGRAEDGDIATINSKGEVWVVAKAEAINSCLNLIMNACGMNQSRGRLFIKLILLKFHLKWKLR